MYPATVPQNNKLEVSDQYWTGKLSDKEECVLNKGTDKWKEAGTDRQRKGAKGKDHVRWVG